MGTRDIGSPFFFLFSRQPAIDTLRLAAYSSFTHGVSVSHQKSNRRSFDSFAISIQFVKGNRAVAQDDNARSSDP